MTTAWRIGYTTGTCAAVAAKAAALALFVGENPACVEVTLPNGERVALPVLEVTRREGVAVASVRKDAGDDPDVIDRMVVCVTVERGQGTAIEFKAGPGVGTITLPGLAFPPGEPAINPAPRRQIEAALREVTELGLIVTVSIPGGETVAERTYNPRLGVQGGLSILGTDGRVRPFSHERLVSALKLSIDVARENGVRHPVLVPGHQGRRYALASLGCVDTQVIEVANEVGTLLAYCVERGLTRVLLFGHPGKLAKVISGEFDTHSSRSRPATEAVLALAQRMGLSIAAGLPTTEAIFMRSSRGHSSEARKAGCRRDS